MTAYRKQQIKELGTAAALSTVAVLVMLWAGQAKGEEAAGIDRAGAAPAPAKHGRHHRQRRVIVPVDANGNIITVSTAAGISITIAADLAPKMQGFIADLVARGYHPKRINCLSFARSHVAHSLHFRGEACDFDQHGWGKTAAAMYRVSDLTAKWGLRNGCSFSDCGHVDSGRGIARRTWPRVAAQ